MRLRALLVLLVSLAIQGCGASTGGTTARASVPEVEVAGLARVEQAIAEHHGHPLLLNFWATWCAPCVAELPDLLAVAAEHEVRVLGVSFDLMLPNKQPDETSALVRAFLERRDLAPLDADLRRLRLRGDQRALQPPGRDPRHAGHRQRGQRGRPARGRGLARPLRPIGAQGARSLTPAALGCARTPSDCARVRT